MHSNSAPTLSPHNRPASNVATLGSEVKARRPPLNPGAPANKIWTDGQQHLGDEPWPNHAIPLFVFVGNENEVPPVICYREEVKITLREERYVNFCMRLRCGMGDRYSGGSIGLVYSPDASEVPVGAEGQLATIVDITVMPDSSVVLRVVGDLPFRVGQLGCRGVGEECKWLL